VSRLAVPKTYKLYIGGAFPRSESGRTYEVTSSKGAFLANAAKASRKDAREAVGGSSVVLRGPEAHAEVIDGRLSLAGEQVANLLPVTQAVLRALVTGDWEL